MENKKTEKLSNELFETINLLIHRYGACLDHAVEMNNLEDIRLYHILLKGFTTYILLDVPNEESMAILDKYHIMGNPFRDKKPKPLLVEIILLIKGYVSRKRQSLFKSRCATVITDNAVELIVGMARQRLLEKAKKKD